MPKAEAARIACTKSYYNQLKSKAYQVTVNYDLHTSDDDDYYYFTITVSNIEPGVVVNFAGLSIKHSDEEDIHEIHYELLGGKTYEIEMYGDEGYPCVGELLYTKKITIPKYNVYSRRPECIEYEEFPLCNKWYQKDIGTVYDFLEALEIYKKSLEKEEPQELEEDNRNIIEKIIDFYKENKIITIPITIVVIGAAGYIGVDKYKKRKNRAKIEI